jgi:hypothetical protein
VLGTDGYLELRKYVDVAGRPGTDHLFLVDRQGTRYVDCSDVRLPFGPHFLDDVRDRTEAAVRQSRTYLASRLACQAQAVAQWVGTPSAPAGRQGAV